MLDIGYVSNRRTYVHLEEFILVVVVSLLYKDEHWFTMENTLVFIQLQKWMGNVRIALGRQLTR